MDILLHDACAAAARRAIADDALDLIKFASHLNSMALIRVLTRFDDPNVAWRLRRGVVLRSFVFLLFLFFLLVLLRAAIR